MNTVSYLRIGLLVVSLVLGIKSASWGDLPELPSGQDTSVSDAVVPPQRNVKRVHAATLFSEEPARPAPFGRYHRPTPDVFDRLRHQQEVELQQLALDDDLYVDLELEAYYAHAVNAQFVITTDDGDQLTEPPQIALFQGRVADVPDSWVVLGVTEERVYGIVQVSAREEYWIVPPPSRRAGMPHAVYERFRDAHHFPPPDMFCDTETPDDWSEPSPREATVGVLQDDFPWRVAELALDGDWGYRQLFDTPEDALDYMALLTAVVSSIYERDMQLKVSLTFARVWDTANDPYSATNRLSAIEEFSDYWDTHMTHVPRHLAHLLSNGRFTGGRAGGIGAICDADAYGINAVNGTFPFPVVEQHGGNWDIFVFAHELGHNFGSAHTHCYNPPIDACAGEDFDCPLPEECQVGTIMSYCHTCPGGVGNVEMRFHERVVDVMRDFIENECPGVGRDPVYVSASASGPLQDGTVSHPFQTVSQGVNHVIPGGRVLIAPGVYNETFEDWSILNRPMELERWGTTGEVIIGD